MKIDNNKVNIWNLGRKINIKLNASFIDLINEKIKLKYKTKRKIHSILVKHHSIPFSVFKDRMKRGYKYFIDLEILIILCNLLDVPLNHLQSNIIAYKTRRGHNFIENPRLPVEISPIFDMLIAHFIGDGFVINPKKGRKIYFGYRQYDKEYMILFIKKIEFVFGKLRYNKKYFNKTTQIYFPTVCSDLIFSYYNLNRDSFKSSVARIPKKIYNKDSMNKLAFLLAIIIDEGNVDSNLISIRMKNKSIIQDICKLCLDLEYPSTMKEGQKGMFCVYILSKGLIKLYADYQNLLKRYPEVNLGHKGKKIEEFISRINKPKLYISGNKPKILAQLTKDNLTVNELATKLNMTRQGARYLVKELLKDNKIELKSVVKYGNHKYGLKSD